MRELVALPTMFTWTMNTALVMPKRLNPVATAGVLPHGVPGKRGALAQFLAEVGNNVVTVFAATKGYVTRTTTLIAAVICKRFKIATKTLFVARGKHGPNGMNRVVPALVTIRPLQKRGHETL